MKLKEWGYLRHKPRKATTDRNGRQQHGSNADSESEDESERSRSATAAEGNVALMEEAEDLLPSVDPWHEARNHTTNIVMKMLGAVLEGDSQHLEALILENPNHVNYPIGRPFDALGGRFFNHPAMQQCVILQHEDQRILDIACALPSGPVTWVLVSHGAKGSTHPLGTDLAFHNAIKNGRTYTVQALLQSGTSNVNGNPGTSWRPILQAAFWNVPDVVRLLLDRGALVNDIAPPLDGVPFKTAIQLVLDRRANEYLNKPVRERTEKILKMLLDAGADIHVPPAEDMNGLTPFETFIKPWQGNPLWVASMCPTDLGTLEAFVRKGADLSTPLAGFPCKSPSHSTFEHQILWHSTPDIARLVIDSAAVSPGANGTSLLHEILGCCSDAKRHPADTLRDIEVLIGRGADPNSINTDGATPLTVCIERCPGVDIVDRLKALLQGGADPELGDGNGIRPIVLAASAFEEPLLSQVMHLLVSKFRGRQTNADQSTWSGGYFPISSDPTFAQVLWYSGQNGDFEANLQRMLPERTIPAFRNAAFSVASLNFLESVVKKTDMSRDLRLTSSEMDEIQHVFSMRHAKGLPDYKFDANFVMGLLMQRLWFRQPEEQIAIPTSETISDQDFTAASMPAVTALLDDTATSLAGDLSINITTSLGPNLPTPLPMDTSATATSNRRASTSSTSSNNSAASFFIPSTTQIRWPDIGRAYQPGDFEKMRSAILNHECKSCNDGVKLTKAEYEKHENEHWHTLSCNTVGCKRRFCVAERG
jgi:hypothetical protein